MAKGGKGVFHRKKKRTASTDDCEPGPSTSGMSGGVAMATSSKAFAPLTPLYLLWSALVLRTMWLLRVLRIVREPCQLHACPPSAKECLSPRTSTETDAGSSTTIQEDEEEVETEATLEVTKDSEDDDIAIVHTISTPSTSSAKVEATVNTGSEEEETSSYEEVYVPEPLDVVEEEDDEDDAATRVSTSIDSLEDVDSRSQVDAGCPSSLSSDFDDDVSCG